MIAEQDKILRVYELEPKLKHPTIFEWFDALAPGESFTIENDHDPKPLYYQMLAQRGPVFNWEYTAQGPDIWRVILQKKETDEPTIGSIAAKDMRKAATFKRLGIDFCCGGKKTIRQAAAETGLSVETIEKALAESTNENTCSVPAAYDKWELDFLADYIYNQHHKYFYDHRDDILQLANKVAAAHATQYPQLNYLRITIGKLFDELKLHFYKEEKVLFPYIKDLVAFKNERKLPLTSLSMDNGPLAMMEMEHEAAGDALKEIRKITADYQCPENACNSFRLLYHQLEELEKDMHQHIHLENNILFPKALQLEKELF